MSEYSEWFDGSKFVPFHVGVYEIKTKSLYGIDYSYWDGLQWSWFSNNIETMNDKKFIKNKHKIFFNWRGLANKP